MTYKLLAGFLAIGACASPAFADDDLDSLMDMSLEEILELEVSSVAKKPQDPSKTAAAIFVITDEDIRAAGVTSLYDALRMAPGVEVAEVDGRTTGVAIRGFNWQFTNKLLILVDGREVYSPSLPSIHWVKQSVPMEDIARIEVVRGSATAMWGSSAVNGVINIVTKHAVDTMGGRVTVETSTDERHRLYARYGFKVGDIGAARIYAEGRKAPSLVNAENDPISDDSEISQAGFRIDLEPSARDSLTFQGDFQHFDLSYATLALFNYVDDQIDQNIDQGDHWNLLGRWVRDMGEDNALTIQAYYTVEERTEFDGPIKAHALNIDLSHYFALTDRVDIVYGASHRQSGDKTVADTAFRYNPTTFEGNWESVFAAADVDVISDRLNVFLGLRAEDSPYTDWEMQPTVRAIWTGETDWSVWSAFSRSVRSPTRIETSNEAVIDTIAPFTDPFNPSPLPAEVRLSGSPDYGVEDVTSYEIGYRRAFGNDVSVDLAAYQQDYEHQVGVYQGDPYLEFATLPGGMVVPSTLVVPLYFDNSEKKARVSGIEAAVDFKPAPGWSSSLVGDWRDLNLPSYYLVEGMEETLMTYGASPAWQVSWRNDFALSQSLDASIWLRHVPELNFNGAPAYTDLDLRLSWQPNARIELSIVGQNLLDENRLELSTRSYPYPEGRVARRLSAKLGLQF